MKRLLFTIILALSIACASAPVLGPQATAAFRGTQAIKGLDVLRDAAIEINAQAPGLVSTETTRKIVTYHQGAITTIHSAPDGWKATVETGLTQLRLSLSPADQAALGPYFTLAQTLLNEVAR